MADIQANYIKFSAPEIKESFIDVLRKLPIFSGLTEELITQLYEYSSFSLLKDKDQPVREGLFGQNIYILIEGRLEVFVKDEAGNKKLTDVIFRPFAIFGEQCVMGEPYSTTIEARGEVLLLAVDMSALPDLLEGWEDPSKLLEDSDYQQSLGITTIIANVLLTRLNRLIKDQYKLVQKLLILHQSTEYQKTWRRNVLLTTVFNEFTQNQLSPELAVGQLLKQTLEPYLSSSSILSNLVSSDPVNTDQVYLELARLESLGVIENVNIILMEIIQRLSLSALESEEYTKGLELEPHNLPAIISLSEYLDEVYLTVIESGVLVKPMSKEDFLDGFLSESYPEPGRLASFLKEKGLIKSVFHMSYLMVLICQTCVRKENELNKLIAKCVAYLTELNTPRQNVKSLQAKFVRNTQSLTTELVDLFNQVTGKSSIDTNARQEEKTGQDDVEDLLAQFDL